MVMLYRTESYPQANDEAAVKAKIRECRGSKQKRRLMGPSVTKISWNIPTLWGK